MLRHCGWFVAITSSALLSLCASAPAQSTGAPGGKAPPKLVLFMVIDGFPQDQLVKYYDLYGDRGFAGTATTITATRPLTPVSATPRFCHAHTHTSMA
ncbi:MAG: hypothetical protein WAM50_24655 [Pseudolabrys sp.]